MKIGRMLVAAGALAATGCGVGMTGTSSDEAAMRAYQALGQDVSTTVATYQGDTASIPDDPACRAAHEKYATRMASMLDRMATMSGTMDRHMADRDHAVPADMACAAEAMAAEFERHHAAACSPPDASGDEVEAAEHVAAMTSLVEHQRVRYQGAGSMMGMMDPPAGGTWTCRRNEDGSFTVNGETWRPGMPLPPAAGDGTGTEPWPMPCGGSGCHGGGGMM